MGVQSLDNLNQHCADHADAGPQVEDAGPSFPATDPYDEHVIAAFECPGCGESRMDSLEWDEAGETVTCDTCGMVYTPNGNGDNHDAVDTQD